MLHSLVSKIVFLFIGGLITIFIVVILFFSREIQKHYEEIYTQRGISASNELAFKTQQLFSLGLLPQEFVGYERLCQSLIDKNEGLMYIALFDEQHQPIFDAGNAGLNLTNYLKQPTKNNLFVVYTPFENTINHMYSIVAVVDEGLVKQQYFDFIKNVFIYTAFIISGGILAVFLYLKVLLADPIKSLLNQIKFSSFDSLPEENWKLPKRTDELGIVSRAFIDLLNRLKLNQKSLREKDALLMQHSKMAETGEMVEAIIHQWKQPLTIIGMKVSKLDLLDLTAKSDAENKLKNIKHAITDQIMFMSRTMDDFRFFFKPHSKTSSFSATETIEKTKEMFGSFYEKKGIGIDIQVLEDFRITGVTNEFMQVVLNLFNNAKDAIEENNVKNGSIHCLITSTKSMGIVKIRDNAGGIPNELLPDKLFEQYVTTKNEQGTGIGLYLSRSIVKNKFQGKLWAHNVEGGAEFVIELPLMKS